MPDISEYEAEELYQSFTEGSQILKETFWKWCGISCWITLFAFLLQLCIEEFREIPQNSLLWIPQSFVFLLIITAFVLGFKATYYSIQEYKLHRILDSLEKHSPNIEDSIREKLIKSNHIGALLWERPKLSMSFKITAVSFPFICIWAWFLCYFSIRYPDLQVLMICMAPYIAIGIGGIHFMIHETLYRTVNYKLNRR